MREASALASELMALVEAIADPDMTVGLSYVAKFIKMETGEYTDVLRWSQTVIDLADGDPTKGNFLIGSPLAFAHATRAVARGAWATRWQRCCLPSPSPQPCPVRRTRRPMPW
jgi:hypothetical protein